MLKGILKEEKVEKRATVITYGCQMNVNESAKMTQMLKKMGYEMTEDIEHSDLVFLNTCTVRMSCTRSER